jgi:hypothetical protein
MRFHSIAVLACCLENGFAAIPEGIPIDKYFGLPTAQDAPPTTAPSVDKEELKGVLLKRFGYERSHCFALEIIPFHSGLPVCWSKKKSKHHKTNGMSFKTWRTSEDSKQICGEIVVRGPNFNRTGKIVVEVLFSADGTDSCSHTPQINPMTYYESELFDMVKMLTSGEPNNGYTRGILNLLNNFVNKAIVESMNARGIWPTRHYQGGIVDPFYSLKARMIIVTETISVIGGVKNAAGKLGKLVGGLFATEDDDDDDAYYQERW